MPLAEEEAVIRLAMLLWENEYDLCVTEARRLLYDRGDNRPPGTRRVDRGDGRPECVAALVILRECSMIVPKRFDGDVYIDLKKEIASTVLETGTDINTYFSELAVIPDSMRSYLTGALLHAVVPYDKVPNPACFRPLAKKGYAFAQWRLALS